MVKIQKIFFCDNVQIASYNKRNFVGAILAKEVELQELPYTLYTNLVFLGETTEDAEIVFEISNSKKKIFTLPIKIEIGKKGIVNGIVEAVKLNFEIQVAGPLRFSFYFKEELLFEDTIDFILGNSPYTNQREHLPASGIFGDTNDITVVNKIISSASSSLALIDNYIRNSRDLRKLLDNLIDPSIQIFVFVSSPYKKTIESDDLLFQDFPGLKMFYQTPNQQFGFHDRYIVIDDAEFYSFGGSLIDISTEKISGFRKVTSKEEVETLKNSISKIITNS